jgi:hypothetical protein
MCCTAGQVTQQVQIGMCCVGKCPCYITVPLLQQAYTKVTAVRTASHMQGIQLHQVT